MLVPYLLAVVVLLYGLLFPAMEAAGLASAAWRMEHHGRNWNLLMAMPTRPFAIVGAKTAALALVVAFIQMVLLAMVTRAGHLVLGSEGFRRGNKPPLRG